MKIIRTGLNDSFNFLLFSDTDVFARTYPENIFFFLLFLFFFFFLILISVLFPSYNREDRVYLCFYLIWSFHNQDLEV